MEIDYSPPSLIKKRCTDNQFVKCRWNYRKHRRDGNFWQIYEKTKHAKSVYTIPLATEELRGGTLHSFLVPMIPRYKMEMAGVCLGYGKDTYFTHKK